MTFQLRNNNFNIRKRQYLKRRERYPFQKSCRCEIELFRSIYKTWGFGASFADEVLVKTNK